MSLTGGKIQVKENKGFNDFDVKASTRIYEGALVGLDSTDSEKARGLVAGDKPAGFAMEEANNTTTGDAPTVKVQTEGRIMLAVSGAAAGDYGKAVFASDDGTFTYTSLGKSYVGRVARYVSSGVVMVEFNFTSPSAGVSDALKGFLLGQLQSQVVAASGGLFTPTNLNATFNATEVMGNFQRLNLQVNALVAMLKGTAS